MDTPRPLDQLVAAAGRDLQLADEAYQFAMANGDPQTIKKALRFWRDCMADYDQLKRQQFRNTRARQQRAKRCDAITAGAY